MRSGRVNDPAEPDAESVEKFISGAQPDYVTYEDWLRLDELEVERGKATGGPGSNIRASKRC